jgi:kynurenine formamidase
MYLYKTVGVHLNVSQEVNENADFLLTADHLKQWEQVNGPLPNRCVILVNFGWAHKFSNRKLYYNNGTEVSSLIRYNNNGARKTLKISNVQKNYFEFKKN